MKKPMMFTMLLGLSSAYASNSYIVKFKNQNALDALSSQKAFEGMQDLALSFGTFAKVSNLESEQLAFLTNASEVEYVEENIEFKTQDINSVSTGSLFNKQWGLKNTGFNSSGWFSIGKRGEDINASAAWRVSTGDKKIIVAVIDTGVDYTHPNLAENMWINQAEKNGQAGVDDDGNGFIDDIYGYDFANNDADPMDDHAHGTHCAGVIGASHDGAGIKGVMGEVQIMALKFLTKTGSGTLEGALQAINYAIKMNVDIMSNSWGANTGPESLKEGIVAANNAGIAFIAAAGNSSKNNDTYGQYPANYNVANVISVGSFDGKGNKSSFSNYGPEKVHVFAPGSKIYSTVPGGKYKNMSGTSMATPHVAGVAGLILAVHGKINPTDLKKLLISSSSQTQQLSSYSASRGRVNAAAVLR